MMNSIRKIPANFKLILNRLRFPGSGRYWESRYVRGGNSGAGSYGEWAEFKAKTLNEFINKNNVKGAIEYGCGDGNQVSLVHYPRYIGLDVSATAIQRCKEKFQGDRTKSFFLYSPRLFVDTNGLFKAELALSLDVIYHLIEDDIYELYMSQLFKSAEKYVIVFSTNTSASVPSQQPHVRHRRFSDWVDRNAQEWKLLETVSSREIGGLPASGDPKADFFIYARQ